jgi:SAM-dependent methyltransferase
MISYSTSQNIDLIIATLPVHARLLEVGCGRGELAKTLQSTGLNVVAIDESPDAATATKALGVETYQCDFLECSGTVPNALEGFDGIFFGRSLHHIHPLDKAIAESEALLKPEGVLIVDDFALELIGEREANWLFDLQEVLLAAGVLNRRAGFGKDHHHGDDERELTPWDMWHRHHFQHHRLSSGADIRSAIGLRFRIEAEMHVPYLYRYIADDLSKESRRFEIAEKVAAWESKLTITQQLNTVGLRFVGRRK